MKTWWYRRDKTYREWIAGFVRHAFTPAFGLLMFLLSNCSFGIVAALLYQHDSFMALVIIFSHAAFFGAAAFVCWLRYRVYRRFYKSVFDK